MAFLTSLPARDIFYRHDITGKGGSIEWISWTNFNCYPDTHPLYGVRTTHRWMLRSRGPDGLNESNDVRNNFMNYGLEAAPSMLYDPTNGAISRGDILRSAMVVN